MNEPLHIKYRPSALDEVIGQDAVVKNLEQLFTANRVPHTFLFTGPSGTGKTTLARVIASRLGVEATDLVEVDAARYSGIEQMRELLKASQYVGLGNNPTRFYIIDEAHALSKATWQTLLLSTEQPADHLYWAFCTTEADKVPKTLRTRAHAYDLKPVKWDLLAEYLEQIRALEPELQVDPTFVDLAARQADGSVRQGLVFLSMLDGIIDRADALRVLESADEAQEGPIALARLLVSGKGATWANVRKQLEALADVNPETIRLTILNYATAALMRTESEKEAAKLLAIVQSFSQPCVASERMAPILLAAGSLVLA